MTNTTMEIKKAEQREIMVKSIEVLLEGINKGTEEFKKIAANLDMEFIKKEMPVDSELYKDPAEQLVKAVMSYGFATVAIALND
ncbi:hypothetical protein [Rummeliibacillus stabekisii]|uniref:hypothetical protein n=1 Tax=Rummeliibacillus stabekisii TaxID=241244 RepID=UPI00372032C9